jgi:hypothetical protein
MKRLALQSLFYLLMMWATSGMAIGAKGDLVGFGNIQFGMTKDEALHALEGAGQFNENRTILTYKISLVDLPFTVSQHFEKGRAAKARLIHEFSGGYYSACEDAYRRVRTSIQVRYGKPDPSSEKALPDSHEVSDRTTFTFDKNVRIEVTSKNQLSSSRICVIEVYYHPPAAGGGSEMRGSF